MTKPIKSKDHSIYFIENEWLILNDFLSQNIYSKVFLLVDSNTEEYCLPYLLSNLALTEQIEVISIEAGEEHKHLESCLGVWESLSELGGDRKSLLINLGGGVVTDLGGFVASCFKRGIDFINIPTTLLAMVDASVGGKTGVDLGALKNQIGVINNPKAVIIDPRFLQTLPPEEYRSGYAEMLKHGLIQDQSYWNKLKYYSSINTQQIDSYIAHSVKIKQNVVLQDPTEKGMRKVLNFGHTLGHAIESYFLTHQERSTLLHGEAIAIGMVLEAYISHQLTGLSKKECQEIKQVFAAIYPAVSFSNKDIDQIQALLQHDKKNSYGQIKYALLKNIGKAQWDIQVSTEMVQDAFKFYQNNLSIP